MSATGADVDLPLEGLTVDDRARLRDIAQATDPATLAQLVHAYYRDGDRADRTPRGWLYLHLGMIAGRLELLAGADLRRSNN